jgi:hypothetical protein
MAAAGSAGAEECDTVNLSSPRITIPIIYLDESNVTPSFEEALLSPGAVYVSPPPPPPVMSRALALDAEFLDLASSVKEENDPGEQPQVEVDAKQRQQPTAADGFAWEALAMGFI